MSIYYDVIVPREAEEALEYTISGGEDLLLYGVDDFSEILSWINLVDVTLEVVPACRESLHLCLDWFSSNRERVEVSLTILRDARGKIRDPLYAALLNPSKEYRVLIERVSGGRASVDRAWRLPNPRSLSSRDFFLEEGE